jgi:hypothetical protein
MGRYALTVPRFFSPRSMIHSRTALRSSSSPPATPAFRGFGPRSTTAVWQGYVNVSVTRAPSSRTRLRTKTAG